jgi:hypothetical protein
MKYTPEDNILSKRAKKNKKDADLKSYFDNTHPIFTPSWIKYKNPSLHQEEEEEESETKQPKGMALLEKIYGGRDPCWKGYTQFGMKEKNGRQVPNCIPKSSNRQKKNGGGSAVSIQTPAPRPPASRPKASRPITLTDEEKKRALKHFVRAVKGSSKEKSKGKGKRVYTEEQKNEMMGLIEDFKLNPTTIMGNFIKSKFSQYVNEEMKRRGEQKMMTGEDVNIGDFDLSDFELSSEDEEDEEEEEIRKPATTGAGVRRKKQVNELHLTPAMKVGTGDNLYKVSNPREVQKKAFDIYGKDAIIYKSNKPNKKYQILDKLTGKFVHFGDAKMEDFEKHLDSVRQRNYLNRSLNIKGKWRENPYSPNTLAIMLLW